MSESNPSSTPLRIAIGGDHAGYPLKKWVAEQLGSEGFNTLVSKTLDCGTHSTESCDYPDFAISVAREILAGNADRGIIICGSGVGVSVAANKIPGIRAAICHDTYSAR
jgi:ribose 5-phosphate isomerase B